MPFDIASIIPIASEALTAEVETIVKHIPNADLATVGMRD